MTITEVTQLIFASAAAVTSLFAAVGVVLANRKIAKVEHNTNHAQTLLVRLVEEKARAEGVEEGREQVRAEQGGGQDD